MRVIGIETATSEGSVAIVSSSGLMAECSWSIGNSHSEEIFFSLDKVLKKTGINLNKIDGLSVSLGPGSFTGIRIGITVARTLGQVLNKPVVGIPTLDSLAYNVSGGDYLICPILDALRNEVYTALYIFSGKKGKKLQKLTDYCIFKIEDLVDNFLKPYSARFSKIIFLGPAVKLHDQLIKKKLAQKAIITPVNQLYPRGKTIAQLGLDALLNKKGQKWYKILPLYIRRAEAEVKWEERHLKSKSSSW